MGSKALLSEGNEKIELLQECIKKTPDSSSNNIIQFLMKKVALAVQLAVSGDIVSLLIDFLDWSS